MYPLLLNVPLGCTFNILSWEVSKVWNIPPKKIPNSLLEPDLSIPTPDAVGLDLIAALVIRLISGIKIPLSNTGINEATSIGNVTLHSFLSFN